MSGRSGYRKTTRKRTPRAQPRQRFDYLLRFQLPRQLAFAVAQGQHGWGVTVGYNDVVFVRGRHHRHCCDLAAAFLFRIGAERFPMLLLASVAKLPQCNAHMAPLTTDLEAIHDHVARYTLAKRECRLVIAAQQISFTGAAAHDLVYDLAVDERQGHRNQT